MLECKYCDLEVRQAAYDEHVESCGSRTDHCEMCLQRVMLKDMQEHRNLKCGSLRANDDDDPLDPQTLRELAELDHAPPYHFLHDHHHQGYHHPYAVDHQSQAAVNSGSRRTPSPPPPLPPPAYVDQQSVQLDPVWIQTVASACGEEELDDLLAQNMFAENMRQATARDEYHGIGDDVIREDVQANRERGIVSLHS